MGIGEEKCQGKEGVIGIWNWPKGITSIGLRLMENHRKKSSEYLYIY